MNYIDLRSDTVTRPSKEMLEAMMHAEVGDDVFGEDPTVNELQRRMAELFGKAGGLFVPSGCMGNEICVKSHTEPGDEIIVEQEAHILIYETAAPAFLSGVQIKTIAGNRGNITVEQIKKTINPDAYYMPRTSLICLENTHGRSAGSILDFNEMKRIKTFADEWKIKVHLDGARIWNAAVASGISLKNYASCAHSLSVCFSKGLGAPIGSMILGDDQFIEQARKYRKMWGGGMRQVGFLAAAALYALDHNIERLKEDHEKAHYFATELSNIKNLTIDMNEVQTNMVFIDIAKTGKSQSEIINLLKNQGVLVTPERHISIRAVMHLDVSFEQVKKAVIVFQLLQLS
ncbi:MAG: low-specificity L-threonine aldolase [Bacteroidota bacterium]